MKTQSHNLHEVSRRPISLKHLARAAALVALSVLAAPTALHAQSLSFAGAQTTIASGFGAPVGLTVDGAGNIFVAVSGDDRVVKISPAGVQTTVPASGLNSPNGVAVDAAGDVFIADRSNNRVVEVTPGGVETTVPASGLSLPDGVALDGSGNLFIADTFNSRVLELPWTGTTYGSQITVPVNVHIPTSLTLDGSGNLFIADTNDNRVVELPAGGGSQITVPVSGLNQPRTVAVDGSGNLFIADQGNNRVVEFSASGVQTTVAASGLYYAFGVAVDTRGDLFVADTGNGRVVELGFGSANVCPAGQTTPAPCSKTLTLSYNVTAGGALGTPQVLTQGAPSLDFTLASGSTCTGAVTSGSTCTVDVTFTPTAPGTRAGAVQITDGSGNVLAATAIYGLGQAPAIAYSPSTQAAVAATGISLPTGIATDQLGNVYIVDRYNGRLLKVTPSNVQTTVASGLTAPWGVAIDGGGNIFISSSVNNNVLEIYASGGQATLPTIGLSQPEGLAVDGAGDLFIADNFNSRVVEITPAGVQTTVPATGLGHPIGVAVDTAGNVYIADSTHGQVVEVTPAGVQTTVPASGLTAPFDVKVDSAGNVYIADINIQGVVQVSSAGGQATFPLSGSSGVWGPQSLALDAAGDVVVGDGNGNGVAELLRSQMPALSFGTTPVSQTSSPQSVTIQNIGNQPLNAVAPGLSIGANFAQVPGSGTPEDCTSGFSLVPGATCNLSISFEPQATGLLAGSAVLTDNALNGNPATQTIQLSGTGTQASQTITFTGLPATATYGSAGPYILNATASSGLPATYAVTGPASLSGSTLIITGAGTVTVTASQAGNANYAAATPVSQTIVVSPASQMITFNPISPQTQGASLTLTATATSGLPVSFTSLTTSVCTVSGTTATLVNAGTCTIQASQAGNANYAAATPVSQSFPVVSAANFTITPNPAKETIQRGVLAGFILQLNSVNGFNGNVTLSCSGGPSGSKCIDLPMTVKLKSNGVAYAVSGILFPANTTPGTYAMTFTGTSGSITETAIATFTVTK